MGIIPLTQGKVAIVDDADLEWLSRWKWHLTAQGYAARQGSRVYMHREILGTPAGVASDHIDGDKLNNTRCNLRVCAQRDNSRNQHKRTQTKTSRFKGVRWNKLRRNWSAQICVNRKAIHLGVFRDEVTAAVAYDDAAREYFGEYACTNFEVQA